MKVVAKSVAAMALAALVAAPAARAAEATVGVDFSSAYVFRGGTLNDGLVAQPYVDVAGLPVDFGVWGNIDIDDMDGDFESGQFSEIDVYASYAIPVEGLDLSIGYCEYTYPGSGGAELDDAGEAVPTRGIADREISLSAGFDLPLAPAVGVYYGLDGAIDSNLYVDLGVGHDLDLAEGVGLSLGAVVGYIDPDMGEDGFSHYELSASVGYEFVSAGVTYIGEIDDEVLEVVEDLVFTVGVSHSF